MANFIENANLPSERFLAVGSRYESSTVIYYTDKKLLTFTTYKKQQITPGDNDKFMVISKGFEFRPDLVSQKVYNAPDFWWRIMEANDIKDIFEFKAGKNIRIPEIT